MRFHIKRASKIRTKNTRDSQSGIALVTTLLLLLLLTGLSLAMVMSVKSDMMINGFYRNFRGSFYAADSGLNIARRTMVNDLVAAIPSSFSATSQPIPAGTETTVQTDITTKYGTSSTITGNGQATNSWPESYKITAASVSAPICTVLGGTGTCAAPVGATGYSYIYNYSLTAVGQSQANNSEQTTLDDRGSITVNVALKPVSSTTSFAGWGMFIDQNTLCDGSTLVPGTISGPVFTNGSWNFGSAGSYIFTDTVGSAGSSAGFQFSNACDALGNPTTSDKKGNVTIAPNFQSGFNRGQPKVPLPPNDFNQKRAVLDGMGANNNPVTKNDLNNALRNISGAQYPNSGATTGVFLPYNIQNGTPTFTGGGFYVEGDASVTLSPLAGSSTGQVYTIKQGISPSIVTTTITVNPAANGGTGATTVVSGGNTLNISGVPREFDPGTGAVEGPDTMLYVNGNITSLSGPGQGLPAINDGTALTITAASNVAITGDILYKTEPVTLTQGQITGAPADTLIPGNDKGQMLGIFTATGDIQLNNKQANGNLEIDASLASISQGGTGGLTNVGAAINTLNIVGGRIQNNIKNIGATTRNVFFDRRFAQNEAPPWFPSTSITVGGIAGGTATTTVQRIQWVNQSSYN